MNIVNNIAVVIPMYRSGAITASVIEALARCRLPMDVRMRIIVIDDASQDGSAETVEALRRNDVIIITQPSNRGRSAARNLGAAQATESHLLFLDSDCVPADTHFIENHLTVLERGDSVSIGAVEGANDGFWHEYQATSAARRYRSAQRDGFALYGASGNFMIPRAAFVALGGFDEAYRGYGFEDRDLFLRIEADGYRVAWAGDARVIHRDTLSLRATCRKMVEAGGQPALRFRENHPLAYQKLGYGKLDARDHAWLRIIEPLTSLATCVLVPLLEGRLDRNPLPLPWRLTIVRMLVAASYVRGTVGKNAHTFLRT